MTTSIIKNSLPRLLKKALAILIWLVVWQLFAMAVDQEILVATPIRVAQRLWELCGQRSFWITTGFTILRILAGFTLAVFCGVLLAALTTAFSFADALFRPLLSVIKATPVASFIILALVWIRSNGVPVFASFLMVLPFVWSNVSQGIRSTSRELLEVAQIFRFGFWKTVSRVYLPSVLPYFFSAFTTGFGLAWKAGVAAEVIGNTRNSIGGQIYSSKLYLETADLFAWTAVVIILSVVMERLLGRLLCALNRRNAIALKKEAGG